MPSNTMINMLRADENGPGFLPPWVEPLAPTEHDFKIEREQARACQILLERLRRFHPEGHR